MAVATVPVSVSAHWSSLAPAHSEAVNLRNPGLNRLPRRPEAVRNRPAPASCWAGARSRTPPVACRPERGLTAAMMQEREQPGAHMLAELDATPLAELRRRAAIVSALSYGPASFSQESVSYRVDGATRFAWNDSGGQSVKWYFTDTGRALLLGFEHEGELNAFGPTDGFALQRSYYRGVPEDLMRYAADRTPAYENQPLTDPVTGASLHAATGVCWYDGAHWHIADGLLEYCADKGIDLDYEAGLDMSPYVLDRDFTPETYLDHYYHRDEGDDLPAAERAALLDAIRPVFAQYPPSGR
jgi:hypothetical protein